jgi:1,2-diacylglycerol 3-beta-glucosyltransferase
MFFFGLLLLSVIYAIVAAYIARGIHNRYAVRVDTPSVSIIVPVRDEEEHLSDLLDSLTEIDYPHEQLEIIIVNDQSSDRTREIALSYQNRFSCRYHVFDVQDEPDGKLKLKTRPLAQGLDRAQGEIVLMTDADCVVPPDWVSGMVSYFSSGIGMVCGTTIPLRTTQTTPLLTQFETIDWLFLLGSAGGLSGKGQTQALIGNNYSVRMETYKALGTFRALAYSDLDDIALLRAVERSVQWRAVFPADPRVIVYTKPIPSLLELVRQRRRWMKGLPHSGWHTKAIIGFAAAMHILWPVPAIIGGPHFLFVFLGIAAGDLFVVARMLRYYKLQRLYSWAPFYPIFATIYGALLGILLIAQRKVRWKARRF